MEHTIGEALSGRGVISVGTRLYGQTTMVSLYRYHPDSVPKESSGTAYYAYATNNNADLQISRLGADFYNVEAVEYTWSSKFFPRQQLQSEQADASAQVYTGKHQAFSR